MALCATLAQNTHVSAQAAPRQPVDSRWPVRGLPPLPPGLGTM